MHMPPFLFQIYIRLAEEMLSREAFQKDLIALTNFGIIDSTCGTSVLPPHTPSVECMAPKGKNEAERNLYGRE